MATAVYSTKFISMAGLEANASYVVPAGFVAIVRDIACLVLGPSDESVCQVGAEAGVPIMLWLFGAGQSYPYYQWQGRQVVDEGQTIAAATAGGTSCSIRVSGYLLSM